MGCVYTIEFYSVLKKNEAIPFTRKWTELESIIFMRKSHTCRKISLTKVFTHTQSLSLNFMEGELRGLRAEKRVSKRGKGEEERVNEGRKIKYHVLL